MNTRFALRPRAPQTPGNRQIRASGACNARSYRSRRSTRLGTRSWCRIHERAVSRRPEPAIDAAALGAEQPRCRRRSWRRARPHPDTGGHAPPRRRMPV
jgi:hypothetical protein